MSKRVISFLKYRYVALGLSLTLVVVLGLGTYMKGGLNMGIDFMGGVKLIAKFQNKVSDKDIRLSIKGYNPIVQAFGEAKKHEFLITTKLATGQQEEKNYTEKIKDLITSKFPGVVFLSVENVGPAIGDFLKKSAIKLFVIALVLMTFYLSFRFEFKYSIGAMAALFHDITLAILFCGTFQLEFNIPIVAALLTIFGYSVNDTIVIFDRIRENMDSISKIRIIDVMNKSISQSLSRTLLTSLTTFFAVMAIYLIGGEGLNDFAFVLLFGIIVGTYSSVYVASVVVLGWEKISKKN